jgi:biopolymer transport protein ExbB
VGQGSSDAAQRLITVGEAETGEGGGGEHSGGAMEHLSLFGDIANNMMFDGWIAIGICVIMIIVGWTVAIQKFSYLNSIQKGTKAFLKQWKELSADLTAIDHTCSDSVKSFGGNADNKQLSVIEKSPLYQIYHIGSEEIRHRLDRDPQRLQGLSARSIQAIRAALDGGLVHETHRLTKGLVFLTISIAGGPYVGLLGTVVGVMITFAIIAKSGEVDVNSIAPGIASALLATVVGLLVAIPALFIYSYLNSRIKEATSGMQVFIDEFVAKMAEFYPPANEVAGYAETTAPKH